MQAGTLEGPGIETSPNLLQRVVMTFGSPVKLGEALRNRSPWFWTIAIVAVASAVIFVLLPPDLMREALEAQMANRPQGGQQPDPETMVSIARYTGAAGVLIVSFVGTVIIAGVLYLAFNVFFGQEASYRQHLSAAAHISWINLVGFLVTIPVWISTTDMQMKLGLGLLLADTPSSFVEHFLNGISLFGLWSSAALGGIESGLSGGRLSVAKAIGMVLAFYLIWVLVSSAWATIAGGM